MDPISQGALATVASQHTSQTRHLVIASILGWLAGMSPDLDVLIRSDQDPLLFLEYHRQFTHSLIFIPVGGFICAVLFQLIARRWNLSFRQTLLYCTAGYATHALLDSCTSYGTQLFWPFSDTRVSWSNMSIVDPLFTVPIVVLVLFAAIRKNKRFAHLALIWVLIYLSMGVVQRERAEHIGFELAKSRGHEPVRLEAKPGFGNQLLWKVIYEAEDRFYVDGVRLGLTSIIYPGESIAKLDVSRDFPWLDTSSQQAKDIQRFRWFSDDFTAVHPDIPNRIIDVRYSMLPNAIQAFWMIELDRNADKHAHVGYAHEHSEDSEDFKQMWAMLWDQDQENK